MSFPVNLHTLPATLYEDVFAPENVRGRTSTHSLMQLSFPKSRSALWDGTTAGDKFRLQLCSHRKPRVLLLEKALRLAQRHVRHSNKPRLQCFFLGSVCVDSDEEGLSISLDRFDPGRDQMGTRVPSALLPGDILVPFVFSTQTETSAATVVQSEAELHHSFKALQQYVSSRQTLDLCQLIKVKGQVQCIDQGDAAAFTVRWLAMCPSFNVDVQPVKSIPIIPTALLRSLTNIGRPLRHAATCQRGFLTMDHTRKLLLLLESDPKAFNLPLVGLWLSGVTRISNPLVVAWCLRFLFSAAVQDRVLSESSCFLFVLFADTHRAPQFYQCRGPGSGPGLQLDCEIISGSQSLTLYQVAAVDGQTLQCELSSDDQRKVETFRAAHSSFNSAPSPAAAAATAMSVTDQDSGVEDEDLSPRPSPSPHQPAQQSRRVQPSVPELSLLVDNSFTWQDGSSTQRHPPPLAPPSDKKSVHIPGSTSSSSSLALRPPPHPPHLHSTPASHLRTSCTCCSLHTCNSTPILCSSSAPPPPLRNHTTTPPPSATRVPPTVHYATSPSSPVTPTPTLSLHPTTPPPSTTRGPPPLHHSAPTPPPKHYPTTPPAHSAVRGPQPFHHPSSPSTPAPLGPHLPPPPCNDMVGRASSVDTYQLLLQQDHQLRLLQAQVQMLLEAQLKLQVDTRTSRKTSSIAVGTGASLCWVEPVQPRPHQGTQTTPTSPPRQSYDLPISQHVGGAKECDLTDQVAPCSPSGHLSGLQSPEILSVSMCRDEQQSFYNNLMTQLTSRLQESDSRQEVDEEEEQSRRTLSAVSSSSSRRQQSDDFVVSRQEVEEESSKKRTSPAMSSTSTRWEQSDDFVVSRQEVEEEEESSKKRSSPAMSSTSSRRQQSPDLLHGRPEVEEKDRSRKRRSLSAASSSSSRRQQSPDRVVSATVRQLQQLGVDLDEGDMTESDTRRVLENVSTLACISPAAAVSRLSAPSVSCVSAGGSVDLSLEANAIALRYLSDTQLSRLSLRGHAPHLAPSSSLSPCESLLSPSNMSLGTRQYMRKYGLIEEEEEDDDDDEEQVTAPSQPLGQAAGAKLLPPNQLIRDVRMQKKSSSRNSSDKENASGRRPSLLRASSRQVEASVGNILDLSRLRQLPKLF